MGADDAAALNKSYLSASAPRDVAPSMPASGEPGPGLTTLALGEEDGGGMSTMPEPGGMSSPVIGSDYQVTTLAIGEEDGSGGSTQMQPIADDHSIIGGHAAPAMGAEALPEGYGKMQPIYSPGEPEYPAFAKTSQTTDILNFHPVPRSFTATVQQAMPAAQPVAPVTTGTYATAAPATMAPIPDTPAAAPTYATVEPAPSQPINYATAAPAPATTGYTAPTMTVEADGAPQSGNYVSVGSYEQYVSSTTNVSPAAPSTTSGETVYEQFQPSGDMSAYDSMTMPAQPAAAANAEPMGMATSVEPVAPDVSAEPSTKPPLFEKDTPLDSSGLDQAPDPADGKPDYVAPADTSKSAGIEPKADATYITVPLDSYIVDAPAAAAAGGGQAEPTDGVSMGGSFSVIDQPLPQDISGDSGGTASTMPEVDAPKADTASQDDLNITTLAIGEEDGGGS